MKYMTICVNIYIFPKTQPKASQPVGQVAVIYRVIYIYIILIGI